MIPYVYLIGWTKLDTWYCGSRSAANCHPSDLWKTYFTSSEYVKKFRDENGEPDHIEILKDFEAPIDALKYEEEKLREFDILNKNNWLNVGIFGVSIYSIGPKSKETKMKMSNSKKGRILSEETKRKMSEAKKGRKFTKEHRQKMVEAAKNKKMPPMSDEHRNNISNKLKGRKLSLDHRKRISDYYKNKRINKDKNLKSLGIL